MRHDTDYGRKTFYCPHSGFQRKMCLVWHQLLRQLPVAALAGLSLFVLAVIVQKAFYRFAPPSTFLTVQSATVPTTRLGEPMILTLCRTTRFTGNIKADGVRTFFRVIEGNRSESGSTYNFRPDIEARSGCQNLIIPPHKYPSKAGTYYMFTSLGFKVNGIYKEVQYQTPPFLLSDQKQNSDEKIEELQKQIDEIKSSR